MQRPRPAPLGTPAGGRDYTQPPPGGTHYPWEPGGGSRVPGVPDNWRDFYPNEQEGRGDAWIGPKKAQLNREHPPESYQNMPSARSRMSPADFAKYQQGALPQDAAAKANLAKMHDYSDTGPIAQGKPGVYDWKRGGWPQGTDTTAQALQMHGAKPGPLTKIGGAPGSGGYYRGGNTIAPPGQQPAGSKPGKAKTPATNEQLGKWFASIKPGQSVTIEGKNYFKNANGAVVDVTNPAARKRITNRQGAFVGQAAAPPPPGTTPAPGTTPPPTTQPPGRVPIGNQPPPTTPGGPIQRPVDQPPPTMPINPPEAQYPPTNQPPYQYDPYSMNQFAYQGQGPGPYGWNPGYGGPPFNYSNFGNAIMQGMGGGGGYGGGYGGGMMPQMQDYMQSMMGGMGGGYGWPEQNMGGYGGGSPWENQLVGYGGGMDYGYDPNMMGLGMGQGMMGYY
jgi:hypothetical protein